MILQALCDYYERKPKVGEPGVAAGEGVPPLGMEENGLGFIIVLDDTGSFVNIEDIRVEGGRTRSSRPMIVPMSRDRTGKNAWQTAFLLWDHPRYVLGVLGEKDAPEMARKRIGAFCSTIGKAFPDTSVDRGVHAVDRFYANPEHLAKVRTHPLWPDIEASSYGVSFRLRDIPGELVSQSPWVRRRARELFEQDENAPQGICAVSGVTGLIQVLHSATPIYGAKSTAKLHSFNERAFESYGKRERQGENAPVGKRAAFAYTAALNHLLRRDSSQKLQVGDATTVFWADHDCELENDFAIFFDEPRKDDADPDRGTRAVAALLESVKQGVGPVLDNKTRFFVLGLAPNAARIAIRFWLTGTVAEMAGRIVRHFRNLEIDRHPEAKPYLSLFRLLVAIAPQGKAENIPPNLGGELMRAILSGLPYPETLFQNAIRRIRMERDVGYVRAAILKACLNRKHFPNEKEITVSLDKDNTNPGYRLGRLFAVLERVQEEASPGLNATIRDRYYGAFSATPASVFATLMRMKNHHLAKLDNPGRRANLEKLIGEIVDGLPPAPPAHLALADQGRFAIGYYHQRMDRATYSNAPQSTAITIEETQHG
jgi:CRISPR-associated protein Csd1